MIDVAVQRLKKLFPESEIQIFSDVDKEELPKYIYGVYPVRNKYHSDYSSRLKIKASNLLVGHRYQLNQEIKQIISEADLIVTSGGGYLGIGAFKEHAKSVLDLLRLATHLGKTTAILGHGFGSTQDQELHSKFKKFLPDLNLITVRERLASVPLLRSLGVAENKIAITGDDAVELAYQNRTNNQGDAIGVNVRISYYSNIDDGVFLPIKEAITEASKILNARLIATPISLVDEESDVNTARVLNLDEDGQGLDTPLKVIHQVGRCRVVVTGSYHAGVFALSQGIPVIGLANSKYYEEKFAGLADQFGVGCKVILFSDYPNTLKQELINSIKDAWENAETLRVPLLESAQKQIERGYAAYERLADYVSQR